MAKILVSNKNICRVLLQERETRRYDLAAYTSRWAGRVFVDFALPYITFRHHDGRVAADLIDALKKIGQYACRMTGSDVKFGARAEKPRIATAEHWRIPVFKNFAEPYCEMVLEEDNYWRWNIQGHAFDDDIPSIAKYIATLQKLVDRAGGV